MAKGTVEEISLPERSVPQEEVDKGFALLSRLGFDIRELTTEEMIEKVEKIQAYKEATAQVLTRGQVLDTFDRVLSFVPDGQVGHFVHEDDVSVQRARSLGWTPFSSEKAKLESSTGKADGLVRVGDLILVVMEEERYAALVLNRQERINERRSRRKRKEAPAMQGDGRDAADPLFPVFKLPGTENP